MKAVMMSIQPKWCELIASGKKTVEVRKTRPKLEAPFKVYIYETKAVDKSRVVIYVDSTDPCKYYKGSGKVIGEFVCDDIKAFDVPYPAYSDKMDKTILEKSCIRYYDLHRYAWHDCLYAWNISDLVIYDEPKKLSEFIRLCPEWEKEEITEKCIACTHFYRTYEECKAACDCEGEIHLAKAPQSWCYVEELEVTK